MSKDRIDKINYRLNKLSTYIKILNKHKDTTVDQLIKDMDKRGVVER